MADSVTKIQGVVLAGLAVAQIVSLVLGRRRSNEVDRIDKNTIRDLRRLEALELRLEEIAVRQGSVLADRFHGVSTQINRIDKVFGDHVDRIDENILREQKRLESLENEVARLRSLLE